MRKLILLLAAASVTLTGCLKNENEPSKFEPVRAGLIIYQTSADQNLMAMQSAEIGVRMGMLLAEAKKQNKLEKLEDVSVEGIGKVQAYLLGTEPYTKIKKTTEGYELTFNHSRGYKDYYIHKGTYRIVTNGAAQLSEATEENPWTILFEGDEPFVQEVYNGEGGKTVYYAGGVTTIYNTGTNSYRIKLENIVCYLQEQLKSDWSGDFSWTPGGADLTVSANIGKNSEFSGKGHGLSYYSFNQRTGASLSYELESGIMAGYRSLSSGTEICRLMSTSDYNPAEFPSPEVRVTWSNEGRAYTVNYNGNVVSSN